MLVPALLGYIVGAVGVYTLLYKLSPVVADDRDARVFASNQSGQAEVIELFPRRIDDENAHVRKAA